MHSSSFLPEQHIANKHDEEGDHRSEISLYPRNRLINPQEDQCCREIRQHHRQAHKLKKTVERGFQLGSC